MARKRKSKPTSKRRSAKQNLKDRYAHAREDAQLAGLIATTPEEALTPEAVDPAAQSEQLITSIPVQAARNGWATPEHKKPRVVNELLGVVESEEAKPFEKVMAANALGKLDQIQHDRDNPKPKDPGTPLNLNLNLQNNVVLSPFEQYKMELEAAQVDEVAQALEAVDEKASQQNPGPLQEALAGDEAVRPPA